MSGDHTHHHTPTPLLDLAERIRAREVSIEATVRASLDHARTLNPKLNALTQILDESALRRARSLDVSLSRGEPIGPLGGVPIVLKDNICTRDGFTTCGSRFLERYASPFDATVTERLRDAGAVIIGKGNLDEFAMGGSGENSALGPTRNPWDLTRVPGGSSSGSAAAVAAGIAPGALGSDTGGSIRQPAGWTNLTGLKPTYGRVSRYGLVAFASSLDQIGPMAHSALDCAALLAAIAGEDPRDSTCAATAPEDFVTIVGEQVHRGSFKIAIPRQARSSANHPAVSAALDHAAKIYQDAGATIVDIDLPHTDYGIAAYYIIATAEASSNLARFDGVRFGRRANLAPSDDLMALYCRSRSEGFGPEVQRRIMLGTHVLSSGYYDAYYNTALKARRLIKSDYDAAFADGCQAILMPSSPGPAIKLGEKSGDPLAMYLEDVYTVGVNLAGLPGVTFPAGFANVDGRDLPVGMQLIGPALGEAAILRLAHLFQQFTEHHTRRAAM